MVRSSHSVDAYRSPLLDSEGSPSANAMNRGHEHTMDTTKPAGVDAALERLETMVSRLMERCASLHEENRLLHDQLRQLRADRAAAKERTEQARHRVEGMIARLRTMEHPE